MAHYPHPAGPEQITRPQTPILRGSANLTDDLTDGVSERLLIFGRKLAEASDDEHLLDCGDDGLDGRGLDEARRLPAGDERLAERA